MCVVCVFVETTVMYSSSTANAVLEAARKAKSPIMIQVSNGGGEFLVGKGVKFADAATAGSVALALHVRSVAKYYGIPVVLHSDHCAKKLLPWFDGMLKADEEFYAKFGEPLFSSHMLDLSEEPDDENIAICVEYFKRMVPMKLWLEMEIGITGGEEDGVNNENVDPEKLYTSPEQVYAVYNALSKIGNMFSVAAAFGNVHGVYKVSRCQKLYYYVHRSQRTNVDVFFCDFISLIHPTLFFPFLFYCTR